MAKCVYCEADTKLHINGVPVCKACSEDLEAGRKPPYRERPTKSEKKRGKASWNRQTCAGAACVCGTSF